MTKIENKLGTHDGPRTDRCKNKYCVLCNKWAYDKLQKLAGFVKLDGSMIHESLIDNYLLLKKNAKWEYQCLDRDLRSQGDRLNYKGGFTAWFKEVFLVDKAWEEIRQQILANR